MENTKNLRIKKHFSLIAHDENTVELRHGVWNPYSHTVVDEGKTGNLFKMIHLLDGSLSTADICRKLNVPRAELESLIDHLQRLGVLETCASTAFQQYFDTVMPILLQQPNASTELKQKFPILLIGEPVLVQQIYQFLSSSTANNPIKILDHEDVLFTELNDLNDNWLHDGLLLAEKVEKFKNWENHFIVLAQHNINAHLANKLNRLAYQLKISWLYTAIDGPFLFVGPTIVPNRGACYECFETRIRMNLRENRSYQDYKNTLALGKVYHCPSPPIDPALRGLVASHAAMETLNYVLTGSAFTRNKVLSIYLPTMEIVFNEVLRVSGCATCGAKPMRDDSHLYFDIKALLENEGI